MKTTLLSIFIGFICYVGHVQNTSVPDDKFEEYLETHTVSGVTVTLGDASSMGDGVYNDLVPTSKISGVTVLNIANKGIADLTGIEDFAALQTLNCGLNSLGTLGAINLSNNINLQSLNCFGNPLVTLNLSNNTKLVSLYANNCQLTSMTLPNTLTLTTIYCFTNNLMALDLSGNPNLDLLDCNTNPNLGSIDVTNNPYLTTFYCNNTGLTSLDVTQNTALLLLHFGQNSISSIDLSQNKALRELYAQFNTLAELDVSNNTLLQYLYCYLNPGPISLDLSKNTQLSQLYCYESGIQYLNVKNEHNNVLDRLKAYSTNLTCIQVDDVAQAEMKSNWQIDEGKTIYSLDCTNENPIYVPDTNLFNILSAYSFSIDTNMDGLISFAEAANYTGILDLSNQGITDITGLQAFTGVTQINLSGNNISDLSILFENDVIITSKISESNKTMTNQTPSGLEVLDCSNNNLTSLDVSSINTLTALNCSNNQLVYLNVQNNASLTTFDATTNDSTLCINVDDSVAANAGAGIYAGWSKDASASYSESCSILGTSDVNLDNLVTVYPNPVKDILQFDLI